MAVAELSGEAQITLSREDWLGMAANSASALPGEPAASPDVVFAFADTLSDAGVESLEVDSRALTDPRSTLEAIYTAGRSELAERGLPDPDLGFYRTAAAEAQVTGAPLADILDAAKAERPLQMRCDLPEAQITLWDKDIDFTPMPEFTAADARRLDGIGTMEDIGVGDFKAYDMHLMATIPFKGGVEFGRHVQDLWTPGNHSAVAVNPAHGFFVITEPGVEIDTTDKDFRDDILAIGRAGPDHRGAYATADWMEKDEQSPTEKGHDGDLYVANRKEAIDDDILSETSFSIETRPVVLDLEAYKEGLEARRQGINATDIDYRVPGPNSNSFYGEEINYTTGYPAPSVASNGERAYDFPGLGTELYDHGYDGYDLPQEKLYTPLPDDDYGCDL